MLVKTKFRFLFFVIILAAVIFTTCDSPMGMGQPIDWIAPELTLDPVSNPYYVRLGSVLTGTVSDNIGIDKMVFINAATGEELFPVVREGNEWTINLEFTAAQNSEKIIGQVIAYDKAGNSGETSMAFVTMIVDIRAPVVDQITIKRTDTRMADLLKSKELKTINGTVNKENLLKYQNGWFYINGIVSDKETKVQITSLVFIDIGEDFKKNDTIISLDIDKGSTPYYPVWTIKEEEIINAGAAIFGADYYSNYYYGNKPYYYRVEIKAQDMAENVNDIITEEEGYICLLANSDLPRGIVDPAIGIEVSKGTPFPVEFYDDDSLLWAYTGLLTEAQWFGAKAVSGPNANSTAISDVIPGGSVGSEESKLLWLKEKLTGAPGDSVTLGTEGTVYNWNFDKYPVTFAGMPDKDKKVMNLIPSTGSRDEILEYVKTSNSELDCGDYYLFTLTADNKEKNGINENDGKGPKWTNKNMWNGRVIKVKIKDDNAPLIVFDTSKYLDPKNPTQYPNKDWCPEENTFPDPLFDVDGSYSISSGKDKKYFNLVGYTLRENGGGSNNRVTRFRMAWIPFGMPGGPDYYVAQVQDALKTDSNYPAGVQHWSFTEGGAGNTWNLTDSGNVTIDNNLYRKQNFIKKFDVMNDFIYNGKIENQTKLFILYAYDSTTHEVFRQLRLLGLDEKPKLYVYDITNKVTATAMPVPPAVATDIPNPSAAGNSTSSNEPTPLYYTRLNAYNNYTQVKTLLSAVTVTNATATDSNDEALSFKVYPRGTIVKFKMDAPQDGKIPIKTLTMKDITYAKTTNEQVPVGGDANSSLPKTTTFCEYYPDVTQRTFLFEATDMLDNVTAVQRTIAISSAAQLESITTTEQNGTYGDGRIITLQANFSSQIYLEGGKPELNVRYKLDGSSNWVYFNIPCINSPTYAIPSNNLLFDFKVPLNAKLSSPDCLQTVYDGISGSPAPSDSRPITLPGTVKIKDYSRQEDAFIPGYTSGTVTMPNWTSANANKTLQGTKTIWLDGVHPIAGTPTWGGKTAHSTGGYYFKTGDSIEVTIPATNKAIRASGNSTLRYQIRVRGTSDTTYTYYPGNAAGTGTTTSNTTYWYGDNTDTVTARRGVFKYLKPGTGNSLVYSLPVNLTNIPYDGELYDVRLYTPNAELSDNYIGIVDNADNSIVTSTNAQLSTINLLPSTTHIYIKQTAPLAPIAPRAVATFGGTAFASAPTNYNSSKDLYIPDSASVGPGVGITWEDIKECSPTIVTVSGVTNINNVWQTYTTPVPYGTNGSYTLQARYKDRAGNEGAPASKAIVMNTEFPRLISINAKEPNGTVRSGTLTFYLNFANPVILSNAGNVKITLENRAASNPNTENKIVDLTAASLLNSSTVVFTTPASGATSLVNKEMRQGLYISGVTLTGLSDSYGNTGGTGTASFNNTNGASDITITPVSGSTYTCKNLTSGSDATKPAGIIVDTIIPTVSIRNPASGVTPSGSANLLTIVLTFREPVMKGSGTITIKPSGNYAIPPVLEDSGYYIDLSGNRQSSSGTNRTYISSFYDIYNNSSLDSTDRGYLTQGTSMSDLTLKERSHQSAGPYMKMTHGLTEGPGYTGNYNNTTGANGPNPDMTQSGGKYLYMVPDTSTKWVLDYQYGIWDNVTAVTRIRNVLTKAKWRWQEIDVVSTTLPDGSSTVTITLNEPLLKGLDWQVTYPEGTFTDIAGNPAPAANGSDTSDTTKNYYFTSPGAQVPVVRVNRRSYDGRVKDWSVQVADNQRIFTDPTETAQSVWGTTNPQVNDDRGWGINNFNYVHFRVESESPGANLTVSVHKGAADSTGSGSAKAAFTGTVGAVNGGTTSINADVDWSVTGALIPGTWIRHNIIRRSTSSNNSITYTVMTKNGTPESRTSTGGNNQLRMFRSYNRDITKTELGTLPKVVTAVENTYGVAFNNGQGYIKYETTGDAAGKEASKSYVVATATKNGETTDSGYEGVFRTVIALQYGRDRNANNFIAVEGSNVKNGMPSISGFPVQDAAETGDNRYIKVFYNQDDKRSYYWVSTEIVCEWYFLSWGGNGHNGSHQAVGEVNNYLTVGYGDLTYGYSIYRSGETTNN